MTPILDLVIEASGTRHTTPIRSPISIPSTRLPYLSLKLNGACPAFFLPRDYHAPNQSIHRLSINLLALTIYSPIIDPPTIPFTHPSITIHPLVSSTPALMIQPKPQCLSRKRHRTYGRRRLKLMFSSCSSPLVSCCIRTFPVFVSMFMSMFSSSLHHPHVITICSHHYSFAP